MDPQLIVNLDQLGNVIWAGNNTTYHTKGAKQVDIVGNDEKRAYTLVVASSAAGNVLPFQQVWSGKTAKSLPKTLPANATSMHRAKEIGIHFAFAESPKKTSHFSTLKTMKEVSEEATFPVDGSFTC
jgi:5-keto 4-deoxyuronate isomerase